ncbi:MAG: AbrB/MazE/SpoVT family DNA-binding domain-containing protein [Verrucomicrobiales bacterium]
MDTSTLSTKGQLVIPTRCREALNLHPGDKISFTIIDRKLILERHEPEGAKLIRGKFGRPVLVAPKGSPPMTVERIKAVLSDNE